MQRERKEGVDFLRSRGNQAGGIFFFLQLQFKSAVSVLQRVGGGGRGEADVLYLQMAEVNLRNVSEVCGGGWLGGGMTIGFRERPCEQMVLGCHPRSH